MSDFTLRDQVRRGDSNRLRRLAEACGNFSAEELGYVAEIVSVLKTQGARRSDYRALIIEDADGPGAFVLYGPRPKARDEGDLYWIAAAPRARGKGLARELVATTERRAKAEGIGKLFIETESSAPYADARRLYAAAGYEIAETQKDRYGPGRDLLIYAKALI